MTRAGAEGNGASDTLGARWGNRAGLWDRVVCISPDARLSVDEGEERGNERWRSATIYLSSPASRDACVYLSEQVYTHSPQTAAKLRAVCFDQSSPVADFGELYDTLMWLVL